MMANRHPVIRRTWVVGLTGLLSILSATADAGGFGLIEQSVSSMGTAYANGSSGIDDASTIYFNPASMTRLKDNNISAGGHIIHSRVEFSGKGFYNKSNAVNEAIGLGGAPVSGKKNDDIGLTAAVPHAAYSHQFNDRMWLGLTVNSGFGLKTKYDDNWVGRYNAIKSDLLTVNINPSFAFKVDEHASIGVGVSAMYADGKLTNAVDGGLADFLGAVGGGVPPSVPWFPDKVGSKKYDSLAKLVGDDWGYGWNMGLMLEPSDNTRLGLHYRSKVDLTLDGDVRVNGPVVNLSENAKLKISLPDSLSLSGFHAFSPKFSLMADLTWTKWSNLDELNVKIQGGSESLTPLDWNDTIRIAVGASYKHSETWLYRVGLAYDETPVPRDKLRSPRVPDADRIWATLGANFRLSKQLSFDFGYAHLFVDDPKVDTPDAHDPTAPFPANKTGFHTVKGKYDAKVDILSAQVNWQF